MKMVYKTLWFSAGAIRRVKRAFLTFKLKRIYQLDSGGNCYFGLGIRLNNPSRISISDHVLLSDNVRIWSELQTGKLILHNNVQINRNVLLDFTGFLELKENVLISEGAKIYTHSHGYDPRSEPKGSKLTIAENAWIGTNAIILPSVNYIGKNAIIGAGAIVSKDVPDNHVYICAEGRLVEKKREYDHD
ncbi:acyltransferase [Vibrio sp. 1288]|uniref:acyltransferase n=1 Tax=Vibrio sp. 1288 TaxID=3074550 RepID=UPI0029663F44|nr:acyltransferase [Vibrio sp. 1288]MDW3137689.1 acyltransferase [Vibrio sp. 1288]